MSVLGNYFCFINFTSNTCVTSKTRNTLAMRPLRTMGTRIWIEDYLCLTFCHLQSPTNMARISQHRILLVCMKLIFLVSFRYGSDDLVGQPRHLLQLIQFYMGQIRDLFHNLLSEPFCSFWICVGIFIGCTLSKL